METGTLKELNVKPGDVVEMVDSYKGWYKEDHGRNYEVGEKSVFPKGNTDNCGDSFGLNNMHTFRIISRAAQTPDLTAIKTRNILAKQIIGKVEVINNGKVWMMHTDDAEEMRAAAETLIRMADMLEAKND